MTTGEEQRERLATPVRVAGTVGLATWVCLSGRLLLDASQWAASKEGPYDSAANLTMAIGLVLTALCLVALFTSSGLLALVVRGVGFSIYAACAFTPLLLLGSFFALYEPSDHVDVQAALVWCSCAFVVGAALAHGFRKHQSRRYSASEQAVAIIGVVLVLALMGVAVSAVRAHRLSAANAATEKKRLAEKQKQKLAEEQRQREAYAALVQPTRAPEDRAWNRVASPIDDAESDYTGRRVVTLHHDGTVRIWVTTLPSPPSVAMAGPPPGDASALFQELGPVPKSTHATLAYEAMLALEPRMMRDERAAKEPGCTANDSARLLEPLRWPTFAVAGRSLCVRNVFTKTVESVRLPGCSRVTGLHASRAGASLLVECPRRIIVFDTAAQRIVRSVVTPALVPGSARLTGRGYMAVVAEPDGGYAARFEAFEGSDSERIALGKSARAPQLEHAGWGAFVVAGAGVCVYRGSNTEPRCPIARDVAVRKLVLPTRFTRVGDARDHDPGIEIGYGLPSAIAGFVLLDRQENPLVPVSLY